MHLLINSVIWLTTIDFLSYGATGLERKWHEITPERSKEEILKINLQTPNASALRLRRQPFVQQKYQPSGQIIYKSPPIKLFSQNSQKLKDSAFNKEEQNEEIWQPSVRWMYRMKSFSQDEVNDEARELELLSSALHSVVPSEPDAGVAPLPYQDVPSSVLESRHNFDNLVTTNKNVGVLTNSGSKSIDPRNYFKSPGHLSPISFNSLQISRAKFHPQIKEKSLFKTSDSITFNLESDNKQKNKRQIRSPESPDDSGSNLRSKLQKVLENIESGERAIKEEFMTALSSLISNASYVLNGTAVGSEPERSQINDAESLNSLVTEDVTGTSSVIPVISTTNKQPIEYVTLSDEVIPHGVSVQVTKADQQHSSLDRVSGDEFDGIETVPQVTGEYVISDDIDYHGVSDNSGFTSNDVLKVADGADKLDNEDSGNTEVTSKINDATVTGGNKFSLSGGAEGSVITEMELPVMFHNLSTLTTDLPYNTENIVLQKGDFHTTQMPMLEPTNITSREQSQVTKETPLYYYNLGLVDTTSSLLEETSTVLPISLKSEADNDQGESQTDPYTYLVQPADYPLGSNTKENRTSAYNMFKKFVEILSSDIYTEGPLENLLKEKGLTLHEVMKVLRSGTSWNDHLSKQRLKEDKLHPNMSEISTISGNTDMDSESTSVYELNGLVSGGVNDYEVTLHMKPETDSSYPGGNLHNQSRKDNVSSLTSDQVLPNTDLTPLSVTEIQAVITPVHDSGLGNNSQFFDWFLKLKAFLDNYSGRQDQGNSFSEQSTVTPVPITTYSGNSLFDKFVNFLGTTESVSGDREKNILDREYERKPLLHSQQFLEDSQAEESTTKESDSIEKIDNYPDYYSSYDSEEMVFISALPTPVPLSTLTAFVNETVSDTTETPPSILPVPRQFYSGSQNTSISNRTLDAVIAILNPWVDKSVTEDPLYPVEKEPLGEARTFSTLDSENSSVLPSRSGVSKSVSEGEHHETSSLASTLVFHPASHAQQNTTFGNKSLTDVIAIIKHQDNKVETTDSFILEKSHEDIQPGLERISNSYKNGSNGSVPSSSTFTPGILSRSTNEPVTVVPSKIFAPEPVPSTSESSISSGNKSVAEVIAILNPFNVSGILTTSLLNESTVLVISTLASTVSSGFLTSELSNGSLKRLDVFPETTTSQIDTLVFHENSSTTVDSVSESSSLAVSVPPLTTAPSIVPTTDSMLTSAGTDSTVLLYDDISTVSVPSVVSADNHSTSRTDISVLTSDTETSEKYLLIDISTALVDTEQPVPGITLRHDPVPETTVTPTVPVPAENDRIERPRVDSISRVPHNHTALGISATAAIIGLLMAFAGIAIVRKIVKERKKVYFIQPRSYLHH
ncbi:serine-rich adhesin for platelets-like isoform X2 [Macrobrachium rosenbergii]|uniref:serine-rich adhesin for platelets-like isoform X2 n=1 Tax=Macrobrachium rosenbergii TaxID=79674 RepID=UPI0034D548D9